jgi:hypothetical protein
VVANEGYSPAVIENGREAGRASSGRETTGRATARALRMSMVGRIFLRKNNN